MKLSKYAKAATAAVVAAGGAVSAAAADGVVTSGEVWIIVGAFLGGLGFTWAVPNRSDSASRE
jgi:predicted type IV restriction endonuclease